MTYVSFYIILYIMIHNDITQFLLGHKRGFTLQSIEILCSFSQVLSLLQKFVTLWKIAALDIKYKMMLHHRWYKSYKTVIFFDDMWDIQL